MDRGLLLLCALLLNAIIGGYAAVWLGSLLRMPARYVRDLERDLNSVQRTPEDLKFRGIALTGVVILGSLVSGGLCAWIFHHHLQLIELVVLIIALPLRPGWDLAATLRQKLYSLDVPGARALLADTPWRHHALLDEYGLARAAIETLAAYFSEKILAPIFWYLLLGLPGLFINKSVYMLQETLVRPGDNNTLGYAPRVAHMWLNAIPARLAALSWMLVSVIASTGGKETLEAIGKGMRQTSPHVISLLAAATTLKVSLGGPLSIYSPEWLGTGTLKPVAYNIRQALMSYGFLCLLLFLFCGFFL